MQISNSFSEPLRSHHELCQLSQKSARLLKGVLLGLFLDAGCVSQGMLLPAPMLVLAALQADDDDDRVRSRGCQAAAGVKADANKRSRSRPPMARTLSMPCLNMNTRVSTSSCNNMCSLSMSPGWNSIVSSKLTTGCNLVHSQASLRTCCWCRCVLSTFRAEARIARGRSTTSMQR